MSQQPPQQYGEQQQMSQQPQMGQQSQIGQEPPMGQQSQAGQQPQLSEQSQVGQQQGMATQMPPQMGQQGSMQMDGTLEENISDLMRVALHDFVEAANVAEWCADKCIDHGPEMAECIRLCRDVADLARLNIEFLTRDSVFGPEVAEVFAVAADACAQECAKHPHRHCQECAEVLPRAARATRAMLASFEGGQGNQSQGPESSPPVSGQI